MPIPTTNLSGEFQFDLENKLILPSKQLYGAFEAKFSLLYQAIREALTEFHTTLASFGQQLYDHPTKTVVDWYDQAVVNSADLSTTINNEIIPELNMFYQSNIQKLQATNQEWSQYIQNSAIKTSDFCVEFYEHPVAMSERMVDYLQNYTNKLSTIGLDGYQQFKIAVISIYQSTLSAVDLFLDAPQASVEAIYYQVVTGLLNLYYSLVSATLELLGNTVPTLV